MILTPGASSSRIFWYVYYTYDDYDYDYDYEYDYNYECDYEYDYEYGYDYDYNYDCDYEYNYVVYLSQEHFKIGRQFKTKVSQALSILHIRSYSSSQCSIYSMSCQLLFR